MILGKLALNESQTMEFGISVFGTDQQPNSIRFIIEGDKFDIMCKCKQIGESIEVDIPMLKGILESKEYPAKLEVIIGDKIFTPLKESIEFNPLIEFGVQKKRIDTKSESVEIKVKATSSDTKKSPLQENIDKVKDKYEVRCINGFNVLLKDNLYCGFLTETSIIESKQRFSTMADLVESMSKEHQPK